MLLGLARSSLALQAFYSSSVIFLCDLVVCDAATRRLMAGTDAPTVVLLSTYDDEVGEQFLAESGAAAYVNKGVLGPDRLLEAWSAARR